LNSSQASSSIALLFVNCGRNSKFACDWELLTRLAGWWFCAHLCARLFVFRPGEEAVKTGIPEFDELEGKAARKAKMSELNTEYFAAFIRELRKLTPGRGCHIRAVAFGEIVKEIIAAAVLSS
jgi:hypothetical protein